MKYLNSLEAYCIVGGNEDSDEGVTNGKPTYDVAIEVNGWLGGADDFFDRHPEFERPPK